MHRKLIAECAGTFALVPAGTGAVAIDETTHGGATRAGVALTFGLVVMAMTYAVGERSGALLPVPLRPTNRGCRAAEARPEVAA